MKDERQRIAERLFESVRVPHYSGHHLRRRGAMETLCGRDAHVVYPVHRTDGQPHAKCLQPAFELVQAEVDRLFDEGMRKAGVHASRA